jgi:hypothetical protein
LLKDEKLAVLNKIITNNMTINTKNLASLERNGNKQQRDL